MIEELRKRFGAEIADAVAVRTTGSSDIDEDVIRDVLEDLFLDSFNAVERLAAQNNNYPAHERAWHLHDKMCAARRLGDELMVYRNVSRLLADVRSYLVN